MTNTVSENHNIDLDDEILYNDGSQLSAIKVGIMDRLGNIIEVVTLKDLARMGEEQQLQMFNYGQHFGDVAYELVIPGTEILLKKLARVRTLQPKNTTAALGEHPDQNLLQEGL